MIVLGLAVLSIGFLTGISIFWTIGIVLVVIGAILCSGSRRLRLEVAMPGAATIAGKC